MKSSSSSSPSSPSLPCILISLCSKKDILSPSCLNMGKKLVPFLLSCSIIILVLLYSPKYPFNYFPKHHHQNHDNPDHQSKLLMMGSNNCDVFRGHWTPELNNGSKRYTSSSCGTIPESKNCFKNGRQDTDFLNWRWKPADKSCVLPRFDSRAFLEIVRGKTMGFVGDSVARNHMESLLCLLSQEEVPIDVYKDDQDRNIIWRFQSYDFTLKILWTKFLVSGEERMINGSSSGVFDLYLDKVDDSWSRHINNIDYIIISAGHWFFRPIYLHKGPKVIACVYCNEPNITDRGVNFALRMAFRTALDHISSCKNCKGAVTLLRTFSPSHFEDGFWNTGGSCNRTSPSGESEIDLTSREWELRNVQVEEIERVNKKVEGGKKRFEALDVTRAMLMRRDGHPGAYWGNKWMKGYNDCVHWCLPGPIDLWNDMLLALLRKRLFS